MARIRTVKPEFWEDETIGSLSLRARLMFIGSWNLADDEGLLRWSPDYLKAGVFMYDSMSPRTVVETMRELETAGLAFPYRGGTTQQVYAFIVNFRKHQRINRPQPSRLPFPSVQSNEVRAMYGRRDGWTCHLCGGHILIPGTPEYWQEDRTIDHSRISLDHLVPRSKGGSDAPSNIAAAHQSCNKARGNRAVPDSSPHSVNQALADSPPEVEVEVELGSGSGTRNVEQGKGSGTGIAPNGAVVESSRERDLLFEAVAEVCEIDWQNLTQTARGPLNKAVADLRKSEASPDEVRRRAGNWPYDVPLTPNGLAKHWPSLSQARSRTKQSSAQAIMAEAVALQERGL